MLVGCINLGCTITGLDTTQNILSHYSWLATHQMNDISPMHEAAASGSIEIMQALSKHGANMFTQLSDGCMPIDFYNCYCIENNSEPHEEPNEERAAIFIAIRSGDKKANVCLTPSFLCFS